MNSEVDVTIPESQGAEPDSLSDEELAETAVLPDKKSKSNSTDNVGDVSVEINVEQLIADIEGEQDEDATRKKEIRTRLEELAEEKSFEDTYAVDFEKKDP